MHGETDLDTLIASMQAALRPEVFVFVTCQAGQIPVGVDPVMVFSEAEGTTLILTLEAAVAEGLAYEYPCRMITLNIHSALEAVGFLARITTKLAAAGLSVNPVSAFFHDHLFVPQDRAVEALSILNDMAQSARKPG